MCVLNRLGVKHIQLRALEEAASAEAVNARQGITGRLDSGVINGIIGVQVRLKKAGSAVALPCMKRSSPMGVFYQFA